MLQKAAKDGNGTINLKDLGIDLNEVVENMNKNDEIMDEMQKPWQ
jgi:hypothetical protein